MGVAYNSLGAYASINQLHFQGFISSKNIPIEDESWQHNGGDKVYPIDCYRLDNSADAWLAVQVCHQKKQAYNLLYRAGYCFLVTRKFQGKESSSHWQEGIAWCEVCGLQTVGSRKLFEKLSQQDITDTLLSVHVD